MCGIVAVVARPCRRPAPVPDAVLAALDSAAALIGRTDASDLVELARHAETANALVYGRPGVRALVRHPELVAATIERLERLDAWVREIDRLIEHGELSGDLEDTNAALVDVRDVLWALRRDRLRTAAEVGGLAGRDAGNSMLDGFTLIQMALSSIDRLEVRGRDSAGVHVFVRDHGLDLGGGAAAALLAERSRDPLFGSRSVRVSNNVLSFVYKNAVVIGELGDNTRVIRNAMRDDSLLRLALESSTVQLSVLAHTRWASVGIISEPNAHPLNQEETVDSVGPYVVAALNGDVDNYADLKAEHGLNVATAITTDAKVIPTLVSRLAPGTVSLTEAFRRSVRTFDGSVAIAAASAGDPDDVLLALRGSGQALYIGLAEDCFIVASEPYGLVEETRSFVRMDGETPAIADQPASRGQVVTLDGANAGELAGTS
jgi:glutamine---fructose-6-phosphate transaminase (isomerizing)